MLVATTVRTLAGGLPTTIAPGVAPDSHASAAAMPDQLYIAGDGAFEFERTASRLAEMQSDDYLALGHGQDDAAP